ncbi:Gamma-glutamyl phosphate reductase [Streptococcus sp. DD10]|uniref:glutamate-5-semialdehyde dehydrogenase n=1 Tax=Streptococcus sp. DD10 TaxID=1777878 RepID=UPI00079B1629|nr:glutamate-5-semialdehyde dehydrogenase [Streptococcus sp. DD10]KXT75157.1 Gamma-glutamyl phosphate reductase [Streptococcus sp. DD10]
MVRTQEQLEAAKAARKIINTASPEVKNAALSAMADQLVASTDRILDANKQDLLIAKGKISEVMLDRLYLDKERIEAMARGIREVAALSDPVGEILETNELDNGLVITKKRVAMGVIGIIYESRPNVTSDAAALALKSGNAVVLRSGKDAYHTASAIVSALKVGLRQSGLNSDIIQLIEDTSRESSFEMMKAKGKLDLLIPRGGAGLIQAVVENAIVPVIETGTGIVHVYVDQDADVEKALKIVENAKTSRPSVCNSMEVLLVHKEIAPLFLPQLEERLVSRRKKDGLEPVCFRLDSLANKYLLGERAVEEDFHTEFLDYVLAVKIVSSIEEAVEHIESHSTHHSEAIVTENVNAATYFKHQVDSAAVYVNASTRFTDGGQFGLGCEMGISTQKLHARGPMGLKELTSYKYIIEGTGQIRE